MEKGDVDRAPIIAMTANVSFADKQKCINSGMDYFVPKPFSKIDLVNQIRLALTQRE